MKRIFGFLMITVAAIVMLTISASAADTVASGYCGAEGDGTNLTWTLDSEGNFSISGSGMMAFYAPPYGGIPWLQYRDRIQTVTVNSGVTSLCNYAFGDSYNLTTVTIGSTVTEIGGLAFAGCSNLQNLTISSGIISIGHYAFAGCSNLPLYTKADMILVTYADSEIPEGATAYIALYSDAGQMLMVEKPFLVGTAPSLFVPDSVYQNMATAKLFVLEKDTMIPVVADATISK